MNKQPETSQLKCKTGEIYQLGLHRLYCGDSTKVPEKLFDSKIRMICTDPPYGITYVEVAQGVDGKQRDITDKIVGDQLQSDEEYALFTKEWLQVTKKHLEKYNTIYIFNSDLMYCALRHGMKEAGFYYSQLIIWIKNHIVVGRKDYLQQHELIAYGWFGRHKMEREKDKSIIFYPRPNKSALHPTMKPIGLLRRIILNATKLGETVYDAFGGSGSTLIACEHIKRKCIMVEMDPAYCEKIIKRWEILTGKKAKVCNGKI